MDKSGETKPVCEPWKLSPVWKDPDQGGRGTGGEMWDFEYGPYWIWCWIICGVEDKGATQNAADIHRDGKAWRKPGLRKERIGNVVTFHMVCPLLSIPTSSWRETSGTQGRGLGRLTDGTWGVSTDGEKETWGWALVKSNLYSLGKERWEPEKRL